MATSLSTILTWFKTGKKPTEQQFAASWSAFWHKNDPIPVSSISGLQEELDNKIESSVFNGHNSNPNAHADLFAKKANLIDTYKDITALVNEVGLYKVQPQDWFKTLVYKGENDITILLDTNIAYELGYWVKMFLPESGSVTFDTDGFILNTSSDELPVLYGRASFAQAVVTDAANLQVTLYGKLQLIYN